MRAPRRAHATGWMFGFFGILLVLPWFGVLLLGLFAPLLIAAFIASIPVAVVYRAFRK